MRTKIDFGTTDQNIQPGRLGGPNVEGTIMEEGNRHNKKRKDSRKNVGKLEYEENELTWSKEMVTVMFCPPIL